MTFPLEDCSEFGNFVVTLIYYLYRDLTYIGKVTVIKTLALPILVQCLTVLPNPPDSVLNDIQEIFDKFLWNGKKDKIKRSVIINEYEGGLKMPHIFNPFTKHIKCHGFINYLTLSTIHHGKYFY